MPKAYEIEIEEEVVNFCLNCQKQKCFGDCEELKAVKKQIRNNKKGKKNECDSEKR